MNLKLPSGMQPPKSPRAQQVLEQLNLLQELFRDGLNHLSETVWSEEGKKADKQVQQPLLGKSSWLRDQGVHGGGWRWGAIDKQILNRCSLNISSVHYDDLPHKKLASATALSCIVHPQLPSAPSLHTHISWTEMRSGKGGGWRLMADLNPSILFEEDRTFFINEIDKSLSDLPEDWLAYAKLQGDRYFYIPVLKRHRGVAHYYVEQWSSEDAQADLNIAIHFGTKVIQTYLHILQTAYQKQAHRKATAEEQLIYHTTYFLQVLTLDRGTSSGLLVHQQNDIGIMGSLPQRVSPSLLRSWVPLLPHPQQLLLKNLILALPKANGKKGELDYCEVSNDIRLTLAQTVRAHYQEYPEALALQARGDILPPTVANHSSEKNEIKQNPKT